ncbi:SulA-like leucine-rich domain-containing protein [Pseudoalteromonas sp. SSDWG2]|uniref:SulA-like leucine-rich domain-containing protein n=1 Tax=Pseudoalteromonas sp. SSDWG2 TaxID=3139391 RepID=UPI003BAA3B07
MLHTAAIRHVKSYTEANAEPINIVQTEDEISASFELLKIIHRYNKSKGWTLLVAPDHIPSRDLLDSCSIDTNKLLVIRRKHIVDVEYVLNCALQNGRYSAVVTWTDIVDEQQLESMQLNTQNAKAQLYCFTTDKNMHNAAMPQGAQVC